MDLQDRASQVEMMSDAEVLAAWPRFDSCRVLLPCEHGHMACSFEEGGPCGDELARVAFALGLDVDG